MSRLRLQLGQKGAVRLRHPGQYGYLYGTYRRYHIVLICNITVHFFFVGKGYRGTKIKEDDSDKLTKKLHTFFLGRYFCLLYGAYVGFRYSR